MMRIAARLIAVLALVLAALSLPASACAAGPANDAPCCDHCALPVAGPTGCGAACGLLATPAASIVLHARDMQHLTYGDVATRLKGITLAPDVPPPRA